ncbi:MAG: RlmF-related methyltransferase [Bacteroidales bacterium]|nr:RlmF-related methyltransferase [Bacteroidales bacterium]
MSSEKNQKVKARLHPRNKNREKYDLSALTTSDPELKNYSLKPLLIAGHVSTKQKKRLCGD